MRVCTVASVDARSKHIIYLGVAVPHDQQNFTLMWGRAGARLAKTLLLSTPNMACTPLKEWPAGQEPVLGIRLGAAKLSRVVCPGAGGAGTRACPGLANPIDSNFH
jgi:hypothetical protein